MKSKLVEPKKRLFRKLKLEIGDERVMKAMERVPRELFVPPAHRHLAYEDIPLAIGEGQTISQHFIVALMTSVLRLSSSEWVLEVGTGSGYQAAVLSHLVTEGSVVTVERVPALAHNAGEALRSLGYSNVEVLTAGPTLGCPEKAPYDAIIVTAASPKLPQGLIDQMAVGGRMVIPIGTLKDQELVLAIRTSEGVSVSYMGLCRFVPLIGQEAWPKPPL